MADVGARLEWTVDQLIEIPGEPATLAIGREGKKRVPAFGKVQAEPDRTPALALHLERHTGQGEKAVIGVEVAGAHRKLGGQDAPAHLQGSPCLQRSCQQAGSSRSTASGSSLCHT